MPTTVVTTSFTVQAGQTYSGDPAFDWSGSEQTFLNLGTILSSGTAIVGQSYQGLLENRGHIQVLGADPTIDVYGLYSGWLHNVVNSGEWSVTGARDAYGLFTVSPEVLFTNSGELVVEGARDAYGLFFYNGGDLVNDGSILVTAHAGGAAGIFSQNAREEIIVNNGEIVAAVDTTSPYFSIGILRGGSPPRRPRQTL